MKERLKNLYQNGELAPQRLLSAVAKGWLTVADVVEIVGEDNATAVILNAKVAEISAACNAAIEAGVEALSEIDFYERYCKEHPEYENNRAVLAIQNIERVYSERLEKHDFGNA